MKKIIYLYYFRGPGGNNQTGPNWLTYLLIYINLHVKQGSNLIITFGVEIKNMKKNTFFVVFFGGPAGRYIKSMGTGDTKMSANADLITVET